DITFDSFLLALGSFICFFFQAADGIRDTLMLLAVKKLQWSITTARTVMEVSVAVAGYLLGGPIGIGTVIMSFGLGPVIQISLGYSQKLLSKLLESVQAPNY